MRPWAIVLGAIQDPPSCCRYRALRTSPDPARGLGRPRRETGAAEELRGRPARRRRGRPAGRPAAGDRRGARLRRACRARALPAAGDLRPRVRAIDRAPPGGPLSTAIASLAPQGWWSIGGHRCVRAEPRRSTGSFSAWRRRPRWSPASRATARLSPPPASGASRASTRTCLPDRRPAGDRRRGRC